MDKENKIFFLKEKLLFFLKSDKKIIIIFFIGILGICIIFFSSIFDKKENVQSVSSNEFSSNEYIKNLENKILDIVGNVKGVGKANVMVTLENSVEYVYAGEEKKTTDSTQDISGSDSKKIQQKDNYERKLILVDGSNGNREALIKKQIEPTIKGVVIVCEGGDDIIVKERVISAITTALSISSTRVCVTKSA